jgi:molybdopterin molybdotransferase
MSRPPLLSLDEALPQLLAHAKALSARETVSTFEADGRVLAQDVISALQVPPQDNSSMDGYAVRCADVKQPDTVLRVTQRIPAGATGQPLGVGEAARIFTGAPIPPGADAVLMQEDCEALDDGQVRCRAVPEPGQWIRLSGEDVTRGATVLHRGDRLGPAALGLAASIGLSQLEVTARPRVALLSTGDELVMPGDVPPEAMPPGAIYNSNRFFLRSLLERMGCVVTDLGIVPDQFDATRQALHQASLQHDLILTSGGVSVGEEDHIKPAVQALGQLHLWSLAIKPGKPFAFGSVRREPDRADSASAHFIGLPGNPVSSFVTFLLLVRPFLLSLQGARDVQAPRWRLRAASDGPKADRRREFLRARRNAAGELELFPNQSSGVLTSAVWADGVIDNPAGTVIRAGDSVDFIPWSEWLS